LCRPWVDACAALSFPAFISLVRTGGQKERFSYYPQKVISSTGWYLNVFIGLETKEV
jgi:hypothetical protein